MFRRLSPRALIALGLCLAVAGVAAAVAVAALDSSGAPPPAAPLDQAIAGALAQPAPAGITAQVSVTDHLFDGSNLGPLAALPLLHGGTGELWIAADGDARLVLGPAGGDQTELLFDGTTLTLDGSALATAVRLTLPSPTGGTPAPTAAPSLSEIDAVLTALGRVATVSSATPGSVAGEPAYTVSVSPRAAPGNSATLSFDASTGVPLSFSLDLAGQPDPALAVTVTSISYAAVPTSEVDAALPAGTTVIDLALPAHGAGSGSSAPVTGAAAVGSALGFPLHAPATLAGLPRGQVRLIGSGENAGALVVYGGVASGGGLVVVEQPQGASSGVASMLLGLLPAVTVDGVSGHELVTGLGTLVTLTHGGVSYTLAGTLGQADAEAAAQALLP